MYFLRTREHRAMGSSTTETETKETKRKYSVCSFLRPSLVPVRESWGVCL